MICNNCQRVENIPSCVDQIIIGSISTTDTNVYVYFEDDKGRVIRLESSSDGSGQIALDLTLTANDAFRITPELFYKVWVTLQSAASVTDTEDLTISGDVVNTFDCLWLKAQKVLDEDSVITITSETLVKVT